MSSAFCDGIICSVVGVIALMCDARFGWCHNKVDQNFESGR